MSTLQAVLQTSICAEATREDGSLVLVERVNGPKIGDLIGYFYDIPTIAFGHELTDAIEDIIEDLADYEVDAEELDWRPSPKRIDFSRCDCSMCMAPTRMIYTVDVHRRGYPVLYVMTAPGIREVSNVFTLKGPFDDPGESCSEFEACIAGDLEREYVDFATFESRYGDCQRAKPLVMYRWRWLRRILYKLTPSMWYWRMRFDLWNERFNPYARIEMLQTSRDILADLLNHASCVCGKMLDYEHIWGIVQCSRCQRLVASDVSSSHECTIYLGDGGFWCKPCVVEVARASSILPDPDMEDVDIVEFVENDVLPHAAAGFLQRLDERKKEVA